MFFPLAKINIWPPTTPGMMIGIDGLSIERKKERVKDDRIKMLTSVTLVCPQLEYAAPV